MIKPEQSASMEPPRAISSAALVRSVWCDFWRNRRAFIVFEIFFKLAEAWLLVPAFAAVFALILWQSGHVAVSNFDIVAFALTPLGLLYAALLATLSAAFFLFEQAGIMVLAGRSDSGDRPKLGPAIRAAIGIVPRIAKLGAIQVGLLALALLPFALLAGLTYRQLLTEFDIYFFWKERPPVFWIAASIGGVLLLLATFVAAALLIRWVLALPILIFEKQGARPAMRASRDRVRGAGWRIGAVLGGWIVVNLLVGVAADFAFRQLAKAALSQAGERPVTLIVVLLIAKGGMVATLTFVWAVGLSLLIRRVYLQRSSSGHTPADIAPNDEPVAEQTTRRNWRIALLMLPLFLLAPLALWFKLSHYLADSPLPQITAHRGNARAAPENTLSAMRKAISSGADYAEMDVQLTADGAIVLLHDRDLKRVAGDPRRLEDVTIAEVRKLDVGSWFNPAFAGERVPTLSEVIELCRGKIRLNIELKLFGPDRRVARLVAELIRVLQFEDQCLITSLNYDALREAREINPRLRIGLTVAHSLGDISRLDVDALSVRADALSEGILRSAHQQRREVHVWTVNDARQMGRFIMRGVDNIITSDPDLAIQVRSQWANVTGPERLILAARWMLGLDPPDGPESPADESQ